MLIENGTLTRQSLLGKVAIVTGAGGGIGYEAARALVWLGARVIIAEINRQAGKDSAARLNGEMGAGTVTFIETDIGDERSVKRLANETIRTHNKVDIVLNNATVAPLGAVKDVSIKDWDASYRVNLRGPVLLAQAFLPGMVARNSGVFACVSSFGIAYMGAYEILKKAQVELASTLDTELEKTGVITFTIGPGVSPTQIFTNSVQRLAPMYGKTVDEFYAMVKDQFISVEAAGAGFAAAIALADRFRGQEILSLNGLQAAGIEVPSDASSSGKSAITYDDVKEVLSWIRKVRSTLEEQIKGWKQRSIFEQQWCIRDFKKEAGLPVDQWLEILNKLEGYAEIGDQAGLSVVQAPIVKLAGYYKHLYDMASGYVKDPVKREEQLHIVGGWRQEVEYLKTLLHL